MKRAILSIFAFCILCVSVFGQAPKYIFYFIGDGMGINHVYGTQLFNAVAEGRNEPAQLTFTSFPYHSFVSTWNKTTLVTDSAAAGTALATGEKTYNGSIGMDMDHKPLKSIAVLAKEAGYGAGVVTTVGVNHATPAAFYGNADNRNSYNLIFDQLLEGRVHFAAGGDILVTSKSGVKPEQQLEKARQAGWTVYLGDECRNQTGAAEKTLCIGAAQLGRHELPYAMENTGVTLADLTRTAINNLSTYHKKGFFLMVEGGTIDHAAHSDDAASVFHEINDMDRAIDVAMEFYRKHPEETLILVTADHETGGMGLGAGKYELHLERLLGQTVTKGTLDRDIQKLQKRGNAKWEEVKEMISQATGLWTRVDVDSKTEAALKATFQATFYGDDSAKDQNMYYTHEMLSKQVIDYLDLSAGIFFGHTSHTGAQVPVFAIGAGADKIAQCRDNTDIPQTIMKLVKGE